MKYKVIQPMMGEIINMLQIGGDWPDDFHQRFACAQLIADLKTPYTTAQAALPFFKRTIEFTLPYNNESNVLFFGEKDTNQAYLKRCAVIHHYLQQLHRLMSRDLNFSMLIRMIPHALENSIYDVFFLRELMTLNIKKQDNAKLVTLALTASITHDPLEAQTTEEKISQWRQKIISLIVSRRRQCHQHIQQFIKNNRIYITQYISQFDQFNKEYLYFVLHLAQDFISQYEHRQAILGLLLSPDNPPEFPPPAPTNSHCLRLFSPSLRTMRDRTLDNINGIINLTLPSSTLHQLHYYCFKAQKILRQHINNNPTLQRRLADTRIQTHPIISISNQLNQHTETANQVNSGCT